MSMTGHGREGPGQCVCGWSAYNLPYYVDDYGVELEAHIRNAKRADDERAKAGKGKEDSAHALGAYMKDLIAEGFSRDEAFALTENMQRAMLAKEKD